MLISLILTFGVLFILAALGMPMAFALMAGGLIGVVFMGGIPALYIAWTSTWTVVTNDIYLAIVLFIFMSCLLSNSGLASDIFDGLHILLGKIKGSLAIATTLSCTIIAALTGLGGSGTVSMGLLAYPIMRKYGYDKNIALGCIPPGGALGPLIPPSILMIILGGLTGVSVGKLFIGGIFPGLLMASCFCLYILIRCTIKPDLAPSVVLEKALTTREVMALIWRMLPIFLLIIVVLGSIYTGIATPTECAGIGAAGTLIIALARRNLTWQNFKQTLLSSYEINAFVLCLLVGGTLFSSAVLGTGLSGWLNTTVNDMGLSTAQIITVILIVAFVLGMLMDAVAVTMICVPLFLPLIGTLEIDMVWFLVVFTMVLVTGYVTPPYGFNLFYLKGIVSDASLGDIFKSVIPFVVLMVVATVLCIVFPQIVVWPLSFMK